MWCLADYNIYFLTFHRSDFFCEVRNELFGLRKCNKHTYGCMCIHFGIHAWAHIMYCAHTHIYLIYLCIVHEYKYITSKYVYMCTHTHTHTGLNQLLNVIHSLRTPKSWRKKGLNRDLRKCGIYCDSHHLSHCDI